MADLQSIVDITISRAAATVSRASFSLPLIAAYHTHWTDTTRTYSATTMLASMLTDGFTAADPAYQIAQVMLSQSPKPKQIKIGRLTSTWTQELTLTPVAEDTAVYSGRVNEQPWTFTSDSSALLTEVCTGIASAIDALAGVGAVSTGTAVTVTCDAAASLVNITRTAGNYTWSDTTAAGTIATEVAALRAADPDWYGLVIDRVGKLPIEAVAAWAETDVVLFAASSADPGIAVQSTTDDVASDIKASGYKRTSVWAHVDTDAFLGAGILALILPYDPGSANWAHMSVAGVAVSTWTANEQAAILGKNGNLMIRVAGLTDTQWGTSGSGDYLDNQQGEDWIRETMQEDVYAFLHSSAKIPYTQRSVARLEGVIRSVLLKGVERGIISEDVPFTIEAPLVEDVAPTDRANRFLPDVLFSCQLSGAINTVKILGLVSV